jgi:NAD(P)-dependent dehydrogenase (short-subunit alcohol dehydrogenase family)
MVTAVEPSAVIDAAGTVHGFPAALTSFVDLVISGDGVLVNMSSGAGFWATAGHGLPLTAHCSSQFAIKGFSRRSSPTCAPMRRRSGSSW